MMTGHCRHDWVPCSDALRDAFPRHAGTERAFRACGRCLRIEELEPREVVAPLAGPPTAAPSPVNADDAGSERAA